MLINGKKNIASVHWILKKGEKSAQLQSMRSLRPRVIEPRRTCIRWYKKRGKKRKNERNVGRTRGEAVKASLQNANKLDAQGGKKSTCRAPSAREKERAWKSFVLLAAASRRPALHCHFEKCSISRSNAQVHFHSRFSNHEENRKKEREKEGEGRGVLKESWRDTEGNSWVDATDANFPRGEMWGKTVAIIGD